MNPPETSAPPQATDREGTVLPLGAWLLLVALVYGTVAQGAFHRGPFRVVVVLLAIAALVQWRAAPGRGSGLVPRLATVCFGTVGLTVLVTDAGLQAAWPTIGVIAGVLVAIAVTSSLRADAAVRLVDGVILCGLIASATAWAGVALHRDPWGLVVQGIWRGSSTLTYANATAALVGVAFLLAVARLGPSAHRLAFLPAFGLGIGLISAGSRAGGLAVVVGLALLAHRTGWAATARSLGPVGLGSLIATLGLLPSASAAGPARPGLAVAGLFLGGLAGYRVAGSRVASTRRAGPVLLIGLAALTVVMAVGWDATADVRDARLDLRSADRAAEWDAAVGQFGSAPVFGVGPGELDLSWVGADGVTYIAEYAHNEYLELLATFGLVGLVALVACAALVVRQRTGSRPSALDDGALAALAVLAVHSGFDFLWHIPALALVGGVLIGVVARRPADPDEPLLDLSRETESLP